jgi:(S)-sulfolactate dehydrogenase
VLGLVGFGAIARDTAARARALGMEVAAFDPFVPEDDPAGRAAGSISTRFSPRRTW